jgi:hypothetical protein
MWEATADMDLNFSLFGILGLVLYAGCIFHAIRTGRINYWLLILIFLPGLGSIAYLLIEVLPEMRNSRAARRAVSGIGEALDPNRALRESAENLEELDTADNRRRLAEERMKRGQWAEAEKLYRAALVGPLADDPALLIGLAKALSGRGDWQGALAAMEKLYAAEPTYESREARLIHARALEGAGKMREAAEAWRALIGNTLGPEAQVRYGLMMKKLGESEKAREAFADVVRTYGRSRGKLDPDERAWLAEAERNTA